MPNSAATPDTGRQWSPIDCAAASRARVVILARAGMSSGSASVNTFRSHSGTRQCHFRLCHNNTGRSGPIRTSRGRVVTHSFGDDDCCRQTGHHPANSGSVEQCTTRRPTSSISTDSTINPSIPNSSELPWSMLVVLRSDCLRTTSFEGHGPSPHRHAAARIRPRALPSLKNPEIEQPRDRRHPPVDRRRGIPGRPAGPQPHHIPAGLTRQHRSPAERQEPQQHIGCHRCDRQVLIDQPPGECQQVEGIRPFCPRRVTPISDIPQELVDHRQIRRAAPTRHHRPADCTTRSSSAWCVHS